MIGVLMPSPATLPLCCSCLQELPDVRSLHVQAQQLQVELQDLERRKRYKAAEVQTTKESIKSAEVSSGDSSGVPTSTWQARY